MPEPPTDRHDTADAGAAAGRRAGPGAPRWVKVSGAVALAVVVIVIVLLITGAPGSHGPGRHLGRDDTSPAGAPAGADGGHRPPARAPGSGHAP